MGIKGYLLVVAVVAFVLLTVVGSIIVRIQNRKQKKEIEKIKAETKEKEAHNARVFEQAQKEKSEVRTGNRINDVNSIANKLHEFATRK